MNHNCYESLIWVAPLAGVTDRAFRQLIYELCDSYGCPGVRCVTEMVSCQALHHNNRQTLAMLDLAGEPEPRTVQIFGGDPALIAEGARRVVSLGASAVNINMGCPVPKIVSNGEGAALLNDIALAAEIAEAVVAAVGVDIPVSVKTRLGWDEEHIVILDLAARLEQVGVAALMVHGRTRSQFYGGRADWGWLARVKQVVRIPVIGNGDILVPEDAARMLEQTGCDGVMIGRGMLGNPWMAARTAVLLREGVLPPEVAPAERMRVARRHCELLVRYKGEAVAVKEMRKHALWYTKGVRGAARLRPQMSQIRSVAEFEGLMEEAFGAMDN
ncbi:MAG: tRNA dihydrouridine synthase DusB [Peptococcaceae bacterium]|nr:tRNA dihydrouridine synthase DusB [Peptococcaceae bacterium]